MILFSILLLIVTILTVVIIISVSIGGAGFIIVFGDVIVCIALLIWIIKKLFFNKNKKDK